MVWTFAYPKFLNNNMYNDPPFMYSFILMHMTVLFIVVLFMFPRWFNFLIPETRRDDGKYEVMPQEPLGDLIMGPSRPIDVERIEARESFDASPGERESGSEPKPHFDK